MNDFDLPETRYALSGDVNIAYQVMGAGPVDLIMVPGFVSHVEFTHELPGYTAFLRRLSTFARVVTFDKRGQGLSDRISGAPSLEQRMDDVRAVMDDIGSARAVVMGFSEGSAMSALFAATYPERVMQLILFGGFALAPASRPDELEKRIAGIVKSWGSGEVGKTVIPSQVANGNAVAQFAKLERLSASPGAVRALMFLNAQIDVRPILSAIRVPTLVLHRLLDVRVPIEAGRDLASRIPDAKFIEYPERDHAFWAGDTEALLGDIEEFVTGHREGSSAHQERVLATVLFTDIVDSTRSAAAMGDQAWRRSLDSHDQLAKQMIEKHRGILVKSTGDGILATFDGPGRAVRCALALGTAASQIGLPLRAGLHTGEIEIRGRDIGGIAVHAAARVMAQSQPREVLVSRVVTDLVAGAGLKFSERGSHELKGLPGRWDLFAASA
ncbi:adenylate/guanylate cyclase domain-containing protein [Bradyrhizobium sp. AUGA SZCCT0222]|uniref:adenylate/guanylate cyclase domain-containing protein n=1 Tax=Bradyrhizobium sp. AUGA SZCCT0222 TaxID=2807668 RepID=UPI001BA6A437|nr:adenylate/guanylate cyclase domain-containing protein [Bradyrhizobium sp. AUGA SZCCT0222]MBR1271824.1 adenylate/guanylate cyclase domain-containing protein [Bradyrhizobium sp. AUGA SZCCT0222]